MTKRQEFSRAIKVEIIKRSTIDGVVYCEGCGLPAKRFDIDHTIPAAMRIGKSRKLTAADGKLLCSGGKNTCHGIKTPKDRRHIAKAQRLEAKDCGVPRTPTRQIQSRGFEHKPRPEKIACCDRKKDAFGRPA